MSRMTARSRLVAARRRWLAGDATIAALAPALVSFSAPAPGSPLNPACPQNTLDAPLSPSGYNHDGIGRTPLVLLSDQADNLARRPMLCSHLKSRS